MLKLMQRWLGRSQPPAKIGVADAARILEARGVLTRLKPEPSDRIVEHVRDLLGGRMPDDLAEFYRERIGGIGVFDSYVPDWNEWIGWRGNECMTELLHVDAVPLFGDGCGNLYGLDLTQTKRTPAVYFFDHERGYEEPEWAAGSSLGAFMLLLADHDRGYDEGWPERWELKIDPEIDRCPRARAIWNAD